MECKSVDQVIRELHSDGATIIESIRTIVETFGRPLSEGKLLVSRHPVWSDVVSAGVALHEELIEVLEKKDGD